MPTDTPPSPALAVAAAERAVEEAWEKESLSPQWDDDVEDAVEEWLDARRDAQAAGYVECWVSREAVEATRDLAEKCTCMCPYAGKAKRVLAHDLAALLKEPAK